MSAIRVLLVDDHAILRDTLAEYLGSDSRFEVVGTAANADDATVLVNQVSPDVVVMDVDMPGTICFSAAHTMIAANPSVRLLFLSAFSYDHFIQQALNIGAKGYLTKGEELTTLLDAIVRVAAGETCFSPEVQQRINWNGRNGNAALHGQTRADTLSPRELEVLKYIASGMSKRQIAVATSLSIKTVDKHATNLMRKLDLHDRVALARFAYREGLIRA